jgi:hypothetical protein
MNTRIINKIDNIIYVDFSLDEGSSEILKYTDNVVYVEFSTPYNNVKRGVINNDNVIYVIFQNKKTTYIKNSYQQQNCLEEASFKSFADNEKNTIAKKSYFNTFNFIHTSIFRILFILCRSFI